MDYVGIPAVPSTTVPAGGRRSLGRTVSPGRRATGGETQEYGTVLKVEDWWPRAGQWFIIVTLVAIVCLGTRWLNASVVLTLLAIPTALSAALIDLLFAGALAILVVLLRMRIFQAIKLGEAT